MNLLTRLVLTILSVGACRADMNDIEALYRSLLAQQGVSRIPTPTDIYRRVDGFVLHDASPEQMAVILPLAAACLDSANPVVRADGMMLISTLAIARPDNASLLGPYYEKIAAFLTDSDPGMKLPAIATLASGYPTPAPVALAYLARHLNDQQNSGDQFVAISSGLLKGASSDPSAVRAVLAALRARPDHESLSGILTQRLGLLRITTPEALEFIRDGLSGKAAPLRLTAVEAIAQMPKAVRDGFAADLQRMLANPDESPEVQARAAQVLIQ